MPKIKLLVDPAVTSAVRALGRYLADAGMSATRLAEAAFVSQPQVSKILRGKMKKVTPDLVKLCEYAQIEVKMDPAPLDHPRIRRAIECAWDGQPETVELIARLIECAAIVREQPVRKSVRKI